MSLKDIPNIELRIKQAETELRENMQITDELLKRRRELESQIKNMKNTLDQKKPKKIHITDHALVRYAERKHGIPMMDYRKEIEDQLAVCPDIRSLKYAGFIITNHTLTTFVPTDEQDNR